MGITLGAPRFRFGYELTARLRELAPARVLFEVDDYDDFRRLYRTGLHPRTVSHAAAVLQETERRTRRPAARLALLRGPDTIRGVVPSPAVRRLVGGEDRGEGARAVIGNQCLNCGHVEETSQGLMSCPPAALSSFTAIR